MRREEIREQVTERVKHNGWAHEKHVSKVDVNVEGYSDVEAYVHGTTGEIIFAGRKLSDEKGRWFVIQVPSDSPVWETSGLMDSLPVVKGRIEVQVYNTPDVMHEMSGPYISREDAVDFIQSKVQ